MQYIPIPQHPGTANTNTRKDLPQFCTSEFSQLFLKFHLLSWNFPEWGAVAGGVHAGAALQSWLCPPCLPSLQVGVFSPSHRNHYLNVTPTNLLRIFPPEPEGCSPRQVRGGRCWWPWGAAGTPERRGKGWKTPPVIHPHWVLQEPAQAELIPDPPVQPPKGVPVPEDWGQSRTSGQSAQQRPGGFSLRPPSSGLSWEEPVGAGYDLGESDPHWEGRKSSLCCGFPT